jgi:hypothetical protein
MAEQELSVLVRCVNDIILFFYLIVTLEKYLTGPFETLKDLSKNTKMRYK